MTSAALYSPALATPHYFQQTPRFTFDARSSAYTDWLRERLLGQIRGLATGDAAAVVDPTTLDYALRFAQLLPTDAPEPDVVVEDDGEIGFDWGTSQQSTFSVSVGPDGSLHFAGLIGIRTRHGSDQLTSTIPAEILALISAATQRNRS